MSRTFFVTGATGFLGAFFASQVLQQGHRVVALVREGSTERLVATLGRIAEPAARRLEGSFASLRIVEGDVRTPGIGLGDAGLAELAGEVTDIWHFAALFGSGERERAHIVETNVAGTEHVLDLAERCHRLSSFNLLSTAFAAPVFGDVAYERLSRASEEKENVYEWSKSEAERTASERLGERGIPIRIFRPSIVIGRSSDGMSLGYAGYMGVFRALFLLRRRLEINLEADFDKDLRLRLDADPELGLNVVPVDFVVEAMWAIAAHGDPGIAVYHITNDNTATLEVLFDDGARALGITGARLSRKHDYGARPKTTTEKLLHRRIEFQVPYMLRSMRFDTANFRRLVPIEALPAPVPDQAFMARCNSYCLAAMEREFEFADEPERRGRIA